MGSKRLITKKRKLKITACYIAKNEADNIKLSIESLIDQVDEIIVVDTGSTDNTVEAAKSLGARVEHFEWINDFAAARNHAISLAAGDVIIFLDCDEWFKDKLDASDRKLIEGLFNNNPKLDHIAVKLINIDKQTGVPFGESVASRIFRNVKRIRYKGRIHEHLDTPKGMNGTLAVNKLAVYHSGYTRATVAQKLSRNIELLEAAALNDFEVGSLDWVRIQTYLVREYYTSVQAKKSIEALRNVLKYAPVLKKLCAHHDDEFICNIYMMIWAASKERGMVSRREIYSKLIRLFKTVYSKYPGTAEIELFYQACFHLNEESFLKDLQPAIDKASRMLKVHPAAVSYYKDYERVIYEKAAVAAWRRRDYTNAMEYSMNALKGLARYQTQVVSILLTVLKGQPAEEIIPFLNTIYDVSNPQDINFLIDTLRRESYNDVYLWYLKKRMDSDGTKGVVRTGDYLSMLFVSQKYDTAAQAAAQSFGAGNKTDSPKYLFWTAVCSAAPAIPEAYRQILTPYSHLLDAYYKGEPLAAISDTDSALLWESYPSIVFAAGFETADRFLSIFKNDPALCFRVKGDYCETNGSYDQLLNEDASKIDKLDLSCRRFLIFAQINADRFDEAYQQIEDFLNADILEQDLFHMLLVIAEAADGETGAKARTLYNRCIKVFDSAVDSNDAHRTGVVIDDGDMA
ncbi:MAG: glycosyltransferase family 2 protein [Chitinispirillia bacterium]|nr:glycosyltransferase family 2 protein [Chitinispirillia bacterium]